jgi:hypothetical protein
MGRHKEKVSVQSSVPVPQIKVSSEKFPDISDIMCKDMSVYFL